MAGDSMKVTFRRLRYGRLIQATRTFLASQIWLAGQNGWRQPKWTARYVLARRAKQNQQNHHKLLLSPNDVKDPLPRIEATSNFVFAQFHNALLAAHSAAATFTTTQLNNNSILNYKSQQQSSPGTGTKKGGKSSPSKNTPNIVAKTGIK